MVFPSFYQSHLPGFRQFYAGTVGSDRYRFYQHKYRLFHFTPIENRYICQYTKALGINNKKPSVGAPGGTPTTKSYIWKP
jgi:hypothetical protein